MDFGQPSYTPSTKMKDVADLFEKFLCVAVNTFYLLFHISANSLICISLINRLRTTSGSKFFLSFHSSVLGVECHVLTLLQIVLP